MYTAKFDMRDNLIKKERLSPFQICIVAAVFLICAAGAYFIRIEFAPDESARKLLSDWIYTHQGNLPTGDEPEIIIPGWGFSYGYRPYLAAMMAAFFELIFSIFTTSEKLLLMGSRMGSVLSAGASCYFCLRTGNLLFEKKEISSLYAVIISFTPQMLFLGMYQNCDSLAVAGVSALVYCLVRGWKKGWYGGNCVYLGLAVSVCLLSYYSVYGWLLVGGIMFLYTCFKDSGNKSKAAAGHVVLVAFTVIMFAGWFFARNMILHNGDIFGMASEELCRNEQAARGMELFEYDRPYEQGLGFFETFFRNDFRWLHFTLKSTIGTFGYLSIWLNEWLYKILYVIPASGVVLYVAFDLFVNKDKIRKRLFVLMTLSSLVTIGLSLYQSYFRDFQAQGRYIITVMIAVSYMAACGYEKIPLKKKNEPENDDKNEKKKTVNKPAYAVMFIWIGLAAFVFAKYMTQMF